MFAYRCDAAGDDDGDGDENLHAICASQLPNPTFEMLFTSKINHFT